jgi:uncharacterized protein YfdQ (DUF2303 family)
MEANAADVALVATLAKDTVKVQVINSESEHFAVIPNGYTLVSLREYQEYEKPIKKHGTINVIDVPGMAGYFNRFADDDSMIFGNPDKNTFTGVLDYHREAAADGQECRHRVVFTLRTTERWDTWKAANKQAMGQEQFANFIEDNLPDIFAPDDKPDFPAAADMLEVSRTLQVTGGHTFNQQTNLKDGSRVFSYVENNSGVAGAKGEVAVPDRFAIRLPIYMNQPSVTIECRLRYRINSGKMSMWFDMFRVDELMNKEFESARASVAAACEREVLLSTTY